MLIRSKTMVVRKFIRYRIEQLYLLCIFTFLITTVSCSNPCEVCKGEGSIEQDCLKCDGTANISCHECRGHGYVPCVDCDGLGREICYNCNNSGRESCFNCKGMGRTLCPNCNNSGALSYSCYMCMGTLWVSCSECNGAGDYVCTECEGKGGPTCESCEGSKKQQCSYCSGSCIEECYACDGKGKISIECRACNGTGQQQENIDAETETIKEHTEPVPQTGGSNINQYYVPQPSVTPNVLPQQSEEHGTKHETCSACGGSGKGVDIINYSPNYTGEPDDEYCPICGHTASRHTHHQEKCHACYGKGYIEIRY